MNRRDFLGLSAAAVAAAGRSTAVAPGARNRPPNLVFICSDDQAAWTLRCTGNAQVHSPHLDRFFSESAHLPNHFVVTPVCSPSRASVMTGRYGTEVGITDWINPTAEPEVGLDTSHMTWPRVLAGAGYDTALIGKWHLGTQDRYHPSLHGFKTFRGFRAGGVRPVDPVMEVDGEDVQHYGITDHILTDYAVEYLKSRDSTTPFLLNLHFRWPHAPWTPHVDEDWDRYKDIDPVIPNPDYPNLDIERLKGLMREYLATCSGVDRLVGRILGTLDECDLSENTIVIFTSDNGYNMGHNGMWHKGNGHLITIDKRGLPGNDERTARPNMFDHSLRVPTAVRWPGVIRPGSVVEETTSILDWFPTILAMTGTNIPDPSTVRGKNFLPLLQGRTIEWDNDLYGEYSQHHYTQADLRMYRTPEWKLIRDFKRPNKDELYHLAEDPAENRNLIGDPRYDTITEQLHARLLARMRETDDPVLKSST
ncbi:MAG: arylsulfatase A family protein [Candidatus Hydrogenedentota bacterium]